MASTPPAWGDPDSEHAVLTQLLIPFAFDRFDGQLRDSDAFDTKALGMAAITGAAIALLATVHESLHPLWWLPLVGLLAAGVFFVVAIWPRTFDLGPDPRDFYADTAGYTPLEASRLMLTEILVSIDANEKPEKIDAMRRGLALLVISLLGCAPIILFRP